MPTGYTHKLCEGPQSFRDFLFTCARAMGACIALRDEPLSENLPDNVGFGDYHTKKIEEANTEFLRLKGMSDDEKLAFGHASLVESIKRAQDGLNKAKATSDRLAEMVAEVTKWKPPTKDHEGLKKFMLEQLQATIEFDGDGSYYQREIDQLNLKRPRQVWQEALEAAKKDIKYHTEHARQDAERDRARNEWVRQLKGSVDAQPAPQCTAPANATQPLTPTTMPDTKPENPPAFPWEDIKETTGEPRPSAGMTLRDYFAAKAMQGCLAYSCINPMHGNYHENASPDDVAKAAYEYADAMLKARAAK